MFVSSTLLYPNASIPGLYIAIHAMGPLSAHVLLSAVAPLQSTVLQTLILTIEYRDIGDNTVSRTLYKPAERHIFVALSKLKASSAFQGRVGEAMFTH